MKEKGVIVQHTIHCEASITVHPFHNQDWTRDRPGLLTQWQTASSHTHSVAEAQASTLCLQLHKDKNLLPVREFR